MSEANQEIQEAVLRAKNAVLSDMGVPVEEKDGTYTRADGQEIETVDLVYESEDGFQILQVSKNSGRYWWMKNEEGKVLVLEEVE